MKRARWSGEIIKISLSAKGTLFLCSMPKGENEDLFLFMVLKMHWTAALNG